MGHDAWTLHPDRALPSDASVRPIAREILERTRSLPIVSMHGHVDAGLLARDEAFPDPSTLLVVPDHYLVRMLVSQGVPHDALGVPRRDGRPVETDPRAIWRTFAAHWHLFRGTPTRYWMEHVLVDVLGVSERLSAESADRVYDHIVERLADPAYRPRALFERFGIEILATTDPATSALPDHALLAEDGWGERVVPTFRPDALLHVDRPGWRDDVALLSRVTGTTVDGYRSLVAALEERRWAFVEAGARATDHGHLSADATPLEESVAERIVADALRGTVSREDAAAFSGHMLFEMARMSTQDGLVMQLHPGVLRDHDPAVLAARGPDVGYDIPLPTEYVRALRPVLEAFGHHPRLRLYLFTVDEDVFSRELAPLAGVYPAVRLGAPWWFLDTPDGMRRYREAVTDTAGFYNTTGFVDDTRAFCSIPARHDLARRIDAGFLARLVAEHRLDLDEAVETAVDLAYRIPREAYAAPQRGNAFPSATATTAAKEHV
ncbi:glucuronate isomerase [Cellulomonas fimi]|uniref:Uronate isomerase n=1 Tax=Cellulomonas fimi (strain ATCC 484 / DSM 20113 / JCM 1341 / CCUG 24087 / LMG 16345 / NBRC 15513 / NCIMB 8980 / NCTC 7547 / NRS-133) TaxID=590998 RepID=F4H137_CELFA|nr:glucuronate isomerase [Cellulomonas fimi]AEE47406.1 Glucuronate isomerase [Cellulomonas fimi ATCC 484]NNH05765.1 glucuronate isomerase [Cellulomonas fimi]VEH36126.1 Uronate isomerase [Cellulomonas fimi]